jgi:hypothetical protein
MLDQHVVLLDFLPLIKLRKGVLNYITKHKKNGLSQGDQLYHVREKTGSYVTQAFLNPAIENLWHWNDEVHGVK